MIDTEPCHTIPEADALVGRDAEDSNWAARRKELGPNYRRAWQSIATTWFTIGSLLLLTIVVFPHSATLFGYVFIVPLAAFAMGLAIAHLILWFHEAAHFNLHPSPFWNDRLANLTLGIVIGHDIRAYRPLHFLHHRYLGDPRDPERSYFSHPGLTLLVKSLTGLQILIALRARGESETTGSSSGSSGLVAGHPFAMLCGGLVLHALILSATFALSGPGPTLAWTLAIVSVYPAVNALRQSLEHRNPGLPAAHYGVAPDGPYTRTFRDNILDRVIGGAGFRRHFVHHWDPALSCTQFDVAERYLIARGDLSEEAQKSYSDVLIGFWRQRLW